MRNVSKKKQKSYVFKYKKGAFFVAFLIILILIAIGLSKCGGVKDKILYQQYPIKYENIVEKYSKEFKLDKYLVYSIIRTESRFDQYAVSGAGAKGLMQIQDETAEDCKAKMNEKFNIPDDLYIPEVNIKIGCFYLSHLLELYDGNVETAVAAYNGGLGNVNKWLENDDLSN
ncbi:MAG: lytic transglycosylase domain-containing protein [Oscillospiraceae bacterium]